MNYVFFPSGGNWPGALLSLFFDQCLRRHRKLPVATCRPSPTML
jgi:hypothetical protein